jgi:hypothetical protein
MFSSAEPALPENSPIDSISINYPDRDIDVAGYGMNWIWLFFILSMIAGFIFKEFWGSNMKRLCGADTPRPPADIGTRDFCALAASALRAPRFAGRSARATRFLLIAPHFPAGAGACLRRARRGICGAVVVLGDLCCVPLFVLCADDLAVPPVVPFYAAANAYGKATFERAVILGFDGMDPELADRFMKEGRLPNLAKLRDKGTFSKLRTTFPAISPVAWSTFMTGVNPGKHNIYDFLARDTSNYLPYLSSAEIKGPKRHIKIGKYSIPFGKTEIKAMRKGTPFWHWLGNAGIFSSVIRVPVTFPPEKFQGVLLSGMCVPDLKGSQGTFCLCTTRMTSDKFREGGVRVPIERKNGVCRSYVPGPDNPLKENAGEVRAGF